MWEGTALWVALQHGQGRWGRRGESFGQVLCQAPLKSALGCTPQNALLWKVREMQLDLRRVFWFLRLNQQKKNIGRSDRCTRKLFWVNYLHFQKAAKDRIWRDLNTWAHIFKASWNGNVQLNFFNLSDTSKHSPDIRHLGAKNTSCHFISPAGEVLGQENSPCVDSQSRAALQQVRQLWTLFVQEPSGHHLWAQWKRKSPQLSRLTKRGFLRKKISRGEVSLQQF